MAKAQKQKAAAKTAKTAAKKKPVEKSVSKETTVMSVGINKEYLKSRKTCKVTFRLPRIAATDAKSVCIVGDFNNWNLYANPMKKLKNGNYTVTLELKPGKEYQFRYLIDESKWENDWNADKYVKSPYGDSDNSVVVV
jgi:1,4-alpha-glucan branching enzyme